MAPPKLAATLTSVAWPLSNIASALLFGVEAKPESKFGAGKPYTLDPFDHFGALAGALPRLALAVFVLGTLPSFSTMLALDASWIISVVLRDLAITIIVAGFWDTLLYSQLSPFRKTLHAVKFNPAYPKPAQLSHDIFWALVSTVVSSGVEIGIFHAWARGAVALAAPAAWWTHPATVAWLLTMPYWRITHFYAIHRFIHKWGTTSIPDVGAFLYKHVHSLHHKSRNPTAWSGISMHPVESFLYYTAMLVPVAFGAHPLVVLYCKLDETIGALIGHDGFGWPATGSHDHWLHHHLVTVNYGENLVPWDFWMGTYAGSEDDYVKRFGAPAPRAAFELHAGDGAAAASAGKADGAAGGAKKAK